MNARVAVALLLLALGAPRAVLATCLQTPVGRDVPTALVLTGGGTKGAYEAGALAAFSERGLPIRLVAGSSAGALSAAMVVAGRADRLEATWRALTREQVYSLRAPIFFSGLLPGWLALRAVGAASSLLDPRPLRELITASVELERIRSSPIGLLITATDLVRRQSRVFDNRTVTVDVLLASAAVPGLFPAVDVDGALLVDGGLTGRAPVLEALEAAPVKRALIVLSYAPDDQRRRRPGPDAIGAAQAPPSGIRRRRNLPSLGPRPRRRPDLPRRSRKLSQDQARAVVLEERDRTGGGDRPRPPPAIRLRATRRPRDAERVQPPQAILAERGVIYVGQRLGRPSILARDRADLGRMRPERHLVAADVQDLTRDVRRAIAREKRDDRRDRLRRSRGLRAPAIRQSLRHARLGRRRDAVHGHAVLRHRERRRAGQAYDAFLRR